LEKRKVILQ